MNQLGRPVGSWPAPVSTEVAALTQYWAGRTYCAVDNLVATPGRLMSGTDGITLDQLQFLVRLSVQCSLHLATQLLVHVHWSAPLLAFRGACLHTGGCSQTGWGW